MFLLAVCCLCSVFGIVLIASATKALPGAHTQVPVQIFSFFLGLFLYYVFTVIDVDIIAERWIILLIFETGVMLLLLVFGEAGDTGARSWIRFLGIGIQPYEIA